MSKNMRYSFPALLQRKITSEARRTEKTPQEIVTQAVASFLEHVTVDPSNGAADCLCPSCSDGVLSRGLCPRHYQRARWFTKKRKLDEGWLVRNGRILPAKGLFASDYALAGPETLVTLPSAPPDTSEDTLWLFGFPRAQSERERLEKSTSS